MLTKSSSEEMSYKKATTAFHPTLSKDRDIWIFDLDNTLYPAECNLFAQIDVKMGKFVADLLNTDKDEARRIQKLYLKDHGTTLSGLVKNHGINPKDFLDYVHDIDFSPLSHDPDLHKAINTLPGRKIVYTNGDTPYAAKVLDQLGLTQLFDAIYGITEADLDPKPSPIAFEKFILDLDIDPTRAVMFEDMARNLVPAHAVGMGTVWVNTGCAWGTLDHDHKTIHAETSGLSNWLTAFVEAHFQ